MVVDPNWSNVVLLLHCDGANGSTTFTDTSPLARTPSLVSGSITTAAQKFGTGSLQASGGIGGYIQYADSPDWWFDNGQFTIECWARRTATISGVRALVTQWTSGSNFSWFLGFNNTSFGFFYSLTGTDNPFIGDNYTPTLNAFDFFAVDRDASGVIRVYAGTPAGMSVIASATVTSSFFNSTQNMIIANDGTNNRGWPGQIDEIRITKGVARYAGTITAPTAPFPDTNTEPNVRYAGLIREMLVSPNSQMQAAGIVREVLLAASTTAQVAGIVREVLLAESTVVATPARQYAVTVIT